MSNYRIVWENACDDATLSASPALVTTLPETNLQKQGRSSIARTTSTADQQILGNFATGAYIGSMILWRHNLSPDATIQLELFDGANQTGTTVYDSGAVSPYSIVSFDDLIWGITPWEDSVFAQWGVYWSTLWFDTVPASSFRLTLSDSTNSDGYMQASRLILGPVMSGIKNAAWGATFGWEEPTEQIRTAGGTVLSTTGTPTRVLNFTLEYLDDTERPKIMEMRRQVGLRKDFFISLFPETGGSYERDHAMLGKFSNSDLITAPRFQEYNTKLQIRET